MAFDCERYGQTIESVRETLGDDAADQAVELFAHILETLQEARTALAVMTLASDLLTNTTSSFASVFEFALNEIRDPQALAMVASGGVVSLHLLAAAIEVRCAELVEAELFTGEWNEAGE